MYCIRCYDNGPAATQRPTATTDDEEAAYTLLVRYRLIYPTVKVFDAVTGGNDVTAKVISDHSSSGIKPSEVVAYVLADAEKTVQVIEGADTTVVVASVLASTERTEAVIAGAGIDTDYAAEVF